MKTLANEKTSAILATVFWKDETDNQIYYLCFGRNADGSKLLLAAYDFWKSKLTGKKYWQDVSEMEKVELQVRPTMEAATVNSLPVVNFQD